MDNRRGENNYSNYNNQNNYQNNNLNNYNQNSNYNVNYQNNYNNFNNSSNYNNNYNNYNNQNNYNVNNTNYQNNNYNQKYGNNININQNFNSNNFNKQVSNNNMNNNYSNNYNNGNNNYNIGYSNQYNSNYNYNPNGNGYNTFNPNYNNYYGNNYMQNDYMSKFGNNKNNENTKKINFFSNLNIKKVLLIIFAIIILVIAVLLVKNLMKSYDVKIYLNGASVVEEEVTKCKSDYLGHCYITLPAAKRYDGEVLGYAKEINSTTAEYQIGQKIELEDDLTLYVISRKDRELKIDTSDIDDLSVSKEDLVCHTYNTEDKCEITVPQFNKRGYINVGYSESKESKKITVLPGDIYNRNNTLYPVYKLHSLGKVYDTKESFALSNAYVDVESSCDNNVATLFKEYIKTIDKYWPFLFHGQKIIFHGDPTFNSFHGYDNDTGGLTYSEKTYPELAALFVRCIMPSAKTYDVYMVIVHELAHSFDMQYEYINKKRIAFEDDVTALYKKYKDYKTNRPLSYYAFNGTGRYDTRIEFFAELMAFYYLNYVDKNYVVLEGEHFYRGNFPDDMKKVAEKYVCIGMNKLDKTKCG